jgi:small subunit ribosomal protein S17
MKSFSGVVVSQNNPKTAVVSVVHYKRHRKYKKVVKSSREIQSHYENIDLKVGDFVTIKPSRPFSATKRFLVVSINKKG